MSCFMNKSNFRILPYLYEVLYDIFDLQVLFDPNTDYQYQASYLDILKVNAFNIQQLNYYPNRQHVDSFITK